MNAIVTGATSGIGLAVSRTLLEMGYDVYAFGRDFDKLEEEPLFDGPSEPPRAFHPIPGDLLNTTWAVAQVRKIKPVDVLVNNAGTAYYGLHEELSPEKIQEMVRTNLELPMILTQQLLRGMKRTHGTILNISSVTAVSSNPHGAAYGATKAGLSSFSRSLFDEARKYGVRVTAILPDMTRTDLYRNANFEASGAPGCGLDPEDVANAVRYVLQQPEGVVIPELMIRPQYLRIEKKHL